MHILAIDLSTATASAVVRVDADVVAGDTWEQHAVARQHLFSVLPRLLADSGIATDALDHCVVGLGPGSFSGIRIGIAAATGLALPGGIAVGGIASAEVIAADAMAERGASVTVIGDARRDRFWAARFERRDARVTAAVPLALYARGELGEDLLSANTIATPDWSRLGDALSQIVPDRAALVGEARTPRAETLAALAAARLQQQQPLEPPVPLYLHPPVFVAPRFPEPA